MYDLKLPLLPQSPGQNSPLYNLLNDLRPHFGTEWSMAREQGILNMGVGLEYSYFGRTLGAYGKVAYSFNLKK